MRWKMARVTWFCLALYGCGSQPVQQPVIGREVVAPYGWHQYCLNNPHDKEC